MKRIEKIKSILAAHKNELAKNYGVKKLGVFGSYSRGENSKQSDIDILVEFDRPIRLTFVDLAEELEVLLHAKVDLVSRQAIKPKMIKVVEEDLIYV
jgi:predicted nucleotidyltransferase